MNHQNLNETFASAQSQGMQQALAFSRLAADSFEKLTRQHYAVVGDLVDYTLAQLHVPSDSKDPRQTLDAITANTRELAEKTRSRMEQYAGIASDLRDSALAAGGDAPVSKASGKDPIAGGVPKTNAEPAAKPTTLAKAKAMPATRTAAKPTAKPAAKAAAKPAAKSTTKKAASRKA